MGGEMRYDPAAVSAFYDEYGEQEWHRFHDGRTGVVSLAVHIEYLRRFIVPGQHVLDAGAGPGRFTIELARLGARVTVADLSAQQLELNRQRLADADLEGQIVERVEADVCDLSRFADGAFDAVVCYGGPLSYVMDRADDALGELVRVTRPGGHLLVSVMSLVGAAIGSWPVVIELVREYGVEATEALIRTGDLPPGLGSQPVPMHLFRWSEVESLLTRRGLTIAAASASTITPGNQRRDFEQSLTREELANVTRWQLDLGAEPGAVGAGEHLIVVAQKSS